MRVIPTGRVLFETIRDEWPADSERTRSIEEIQWALFVEKSALFVANANDLGNLIDI